jgi:hypothetical protein
MHAISLHLVDHAFEGTWMWWELNFNALKPNGAWAKCQCRCTVCGCTVVVLCAVKLLRLAVLISRLTNTVDWFVMREKYCSDWKNKLKKIDYKPDERERCHLWGSKKNSCHLSASYLLDKRYISLFAWLNISGWKYRWLIYTIEKHY